MIKNAPYKFNELESIRFEYGLGDSLLNKFDSKTGNYQFVNRRDSLVKMNLRLTKDDMLYLHRKAADLGFWDFPKNELSDDTAAKQRTPRYLIEFNYKRKSKRVMFDANFNGNEKLVDANQRLIKEIERVLDDAEARTKK
ncbi:hypothetical protein FFF34_004305 [Inquilinus sp. KBS0705]|nr:hypothetical protein FFF34_004305 [Inquilinus sp. KBS0705]